MTNEDIDQVIFNFLDSISPEDRIELLSEYLFMAATKVGGTAGDQLREIGRLREEFLATRDD